MPPKSSAHEKNSKSKNPGHCMTPLTIGNPVKMGTVRSEAQLGANLRRSAAHTLLTTINIPLKWSDVGFDCVVSFGGTPIRGRRFGVCGGWCHKTRPTAHGEMRRRWQGQMALVGFLIRVRQPRVLTIHEHVVI